MGTGYLGGIWKRGPNGRRPDAPSPEAVNEDWGWVGQRSELFLRADPVGGRLFRWDGLTIFLRGYARPANSSAPLDVERVAEEVRCHYVEHGTLDVDGLDGSFTLALLDSHAERVILYRNLIGTGFTYYHPSRDGLLFGGNLPELLALMREEPARNPDALPAFFLYRCVPGRETLFSDVYRLLPGEQVSWDRRGLTRQQRHTFADLRRETVRPADALELVEATMSAVLADCAAHRPGAANLLSGGVDSSYIQAVYNRLLDPDEIPASYSISVDHPHTHGDTDYALTASQVLGTRHTLVPADGPYASYLLDALATAGEPLNHVQSAYFGHLARAMAADGIPAGLCGEGADSLFGLGMSDQITNAGRARRLLPARWLRSLAAMVCERAGWRERARTLRLADHLDDFGDLSHPVNQVAAFADWHAVEECFGATTVAAAAADRRRLLDRFEVPYRPQDRLHAAGFLGEAVDSAGLWATLFQRAGVDLLCPFLDSRIVRLGLNLAPESRYRFGRPKDLLKRNLAKYVGEPMANRAKLGFGQPVFEWMGAGGQLAGMLDEMAEQDFIEPRLLAKVRKRPNWFLYSALVLDVWQKLFIDRTLARPAVPEVRRSRALVA